MKNICFIMVLLAFAACSNNDYPKAQDALDAGREFIDGCLKGDFKRAAFYMVPDAENNRELLKLKNQYKEKSQEQQTSFYNASIILNEDATVSDTVHVINYMNSYDKIGRKVKVVLRNNTWLVDFKYTFNGNL
jgi:hypothetical protein